MNTVTAIVANPRKPGRYSVVVDGEEAGVLGLEALERLGLRIGTPADARVRSAITRESETIRVYDRAAGMLAARGRARTELRRLLVRKGEPAELVDAALERLTAAGFLDDAQFARQFTRAKGVGGGMSRRRLGQELGRRGVDREMTAAAIDEVFEEEGVDEEALVEQAAQKKLRTLMKLDPETRRRRLYAYLARRGYDADDIARVVRELVRIG